MSDSPVPVQGATDCTVAYVSCHVLPYMTTHSCSNARIEDLSDACIEYSSARVSESAACYKRLHVDATS